MPDSNRYFRHGRPTCWPLNTNAAKRHFPLRLSHCLLPTSWGFASCRVYPAAPAVFSGRFCSLCGNAHAHTSAGSYPAIGEDSEARTRGLLIKSQLLFRLSYIFIWRRGWDSNPRSLSESPVFKTGSLNRSDTSPCEAAAFAVCPQQHVRD